MDDTKRRWADIYDDLLSYQAQLSCDLEQMFFRSAEAWTSANTILDVGAGNAAYTSILSYKYPDKHFICLESNAELAGIAGRRFSSNRLKVMNGSFETFIPEQKIDFIFARHVLSYLSDEQRKGFVAWAKNIVAETGGILTIDADDDAFLVSPRLPLLEGGNEKFKEELHAKGGNRSLRAILPEYFTKNGFRHKLSRSLVVHSDISDRKYLMVMFMKAVAEIDHGSPLPVKVREEINTWAADRNSYLQYGMFGSLFLKEGMK